MQYNLGMFAPNGRCGYRLKPVCMRGYYYESVPVHRFANYQPFTPLTEIGIEQAGFSLFISLCQHSTTPTLSPPLTTTR